MALKTIMIVDDDPAILDSLSLMLEFEGFAVTAHTCGKQLFEYLNESHNPDVILLDMWLSHEDGRDICSKLKNSEITKDIPVVIMSASRGLEGSALKSGANAFIAKPFGFDEVMSQLNNYVS